MSEDKYIKESDLFKAMENNSHVMEVFGTQRKMVDGILLTYDIAELERLNIKEIRAKVIDEFVEKVNKEIHMCFSDDLEIQKHVDEIAEQMKGDGENE